jgi:predicted 3-demethylubiquinone-9 3-methyltransferase (glyoxalase superfamily)
MAIDSAAPHQFTFTPAMSLFVTCDTEEETEKVFEKLAEGGMVMMALGAYPFSKKFGWVQDRFGVSWQVSVKL